MSNLLGIVVWKFHIYTHIKCTHIQYMHKVKVIVCHKATKCYSSFPTSLNLGLQINTLKITIKLENISIFELKCWIKLLTKLTIKFHI